MMNGFYTHGMQGLGGAFPGWIPPFFVVLMLWSLFWKGLALWHSGRRGEKWWFIGLLLVNTAGIVEIIYLLYFAKMKFSDLLGGNATPSQQ